MTAGLEHKASRDRLMSWYFCVWKPVWRPSFSPYQGADALEQRQNWQVCQSPPVWTWVISWVACCCLGHSMEGRCQDHRINFEQSLSNEGPCLYQLTSLMCLQDTGRTACVLDTKVLGILFACNNKPYMDGAEIERMGKLNLLGNNSNQIQDISKESMRWSPGPSHACWKRVH